MAKPSKAFKKFASSGKLKETIQKRRSTQQARRKFEDRVAQRKKQRGSAKDEGLDEEDDEEDSEDERSDKALGVGGRAGGVGKEVDDLLKDDLRLAGPESEGEGSEDEEDLEDDEDELDEDDEEGIDDDEKDLEMDEAAMKKAMKQLEKNDPEFFKYLKENDQDLLEFGDKPASDGDVDMDGEEEEEDEEEEEEDGDENMDEDEEEQRAKTPVTRKMLREWQEGMLRLHSIRSLRKTLLAFRAAAHMNEEDANEGEGSSTKYTINSPQVFNKLVVTALKFTPVVMAHHIPYKTLPNGRIKVSQPKNLNPRLPKYLLSHFSTILHFIRSLPATSTSPSDDATEGGLLVLAIQESTKLLPWVLSARKHMRAYLKVLLELWSGAPNDGVRIAAFLAVRRVFEGGDEAMRDQCLKQTYRALLPPLRNTTPHTLPSINLLKNTASELFLLSPSQSYTHAFTAIRMLAMHLRDVIRSTTLQSSSSGAASAAGAGAAEGKKDKEKGDKADAFRRVYNWQYVHCVDFWGRVLGGAAVREREGHVSGQEKKGEGEGLGMLVYPFVQVALGVVRLLPSPRYFPLHFHILSTLQTLCAQSGTYIPLSPYLLDILSSSEFRPTSIPRKSTLKPLDLEYVIRAPATYPRTRIYQETIADELIYLLALYHSELVSSIAFPEISLPVILAIKKHLKRAATGGKGKGMSAKVQQGLKGLVDKLEAQKKWSEEKRRSVGFAPRDRAEVGRWEVKVKEEQEKTPLGMWVRTMRKVRDRKREEVEKALRGEE